MDSLLALLSDNYFFIAGLVIITLIVIFGVLIIDKIFSESVLGTILISNIKSIKSIRWTVFRYYLPIYHEANLSDRIKSRTMQKGLFIFHSWLSSWIHKILLLDRLDKTFNFRWTELDFLFRFSHQVYCISKHSHSELSLWLSLLSLRLEPTLYIRYRFPILHIYTNQLLSVSAKKLVDELVKQSIEEQGGKLLEVFDDITTDIGIYPFNNFEESNQLSSFPTKSEPDTKPRINNSFDKRTPDSKLENACFQKKGPYLNKYENSVFVSYAWGGESEQIVDRLEDAFLEHEIHIVRDKKDLDYKGSIKRFEQRIGQGQCIVLVISDKYLRSEHCMYELDEVFRNKNLRRRIFPIVLADAHIYKAIDRLFYIKYWTEQIEQLNQAIKQVNIMTNLSGVTADLDKYAQIRADFDHLTDLLSDMNALTPELHKEKNFAVLINSVKRARNEKNTSNF